MKKNWDRRKFFTLEKRQELEFLLQEGCRVREISKKFGICTATLYTELKKGMTEEDYEKGRYIKYSVGRAIKKDVEQHLGEEELKLLQEFQDAT